MQKTDSGQSAASSSISLPSGGGAIKGVGESFSPDLFTGTGNFSVPIALPAGRNGFQPQLTLVYSSGNGNGAFGLGWNLSVPGVTRKTSRGIPLYDEEKDVFLLSGAEDLVPVTDWENGVRRYRPRTEGLFARIERYLDASNDYWKVWSKDGLVSYYGTPDSVNTPDVYNDPATCANPAYKSNVFEWKLSKTEDVFGNVITYTYVRSNRAEGTAPSDPHDGDMLYLSEIHYGDYQVGELTKFLCSVLFTYENRPDPFSSYRSGFEMRHTLRCPRIELYTHPDDTDVLAKAYDLIYLDARVAAGEFKSDVLPANGVTLLSQVKITGYDGEDTESMPPLEFTYSKFNPVRRDFDPVRGKELPGLALGEGGYELIDLDGNGLPDIVELGGVLPRYWKNLGNATFDVPRTMNEAPAGIALDDPGVFLGDADGDGRTDLIVTKTGLNGYFSLGFDGQWNKNSFRKQTYAPSFSLQDPEVRMLDLDGDGITDVLRNGSRFECFFNDAEQGFYKVRTVNKQQVQDFPNLSFSDPRLRFADMTGDGMQDMVLVYDGTVTYWPNLGHGSWGKKVTMKNNPRFPYQYSPQRIVVGDVDGDGCSDLLFIEDNKVTLWINQGGNAWSDPITISGTPSAQDMRGVRLADLCGWGTASLVWSYRYDGSSRDRMFFLDFNGAEKPYVLNEMNNHMGAITRVEYRTSTYYYLSDREGYDPFDANNPFLPANRIRRVNGKDTVPPAPKRSAKKKWKTYLPSPLQVVAKTEVIDELSQGKLVTQYAYHHGYWDGGEREFRGFGNVVQRDTETFDRFNKGNDDYLKITKVQFTPPLETRNWFHLGPVEDADSFRGLDWKEVDYTEEYWSEDQQVLQRPADMIALLKGLPRRARRDAYRTLRGSMLRSEVYALDGTARQNRPYTVTENLQGVRLEFTPATLSPALSVADLVATNKQGSGYIFFSFGVSSRTTQWERGEEPMSSFSFSEAYDAYGMPLKQVAIAVPRGKNPLSGGGPDAYLCTYSEKAVINKDDATHYLIGRVIRSTGFEYANAGSGSVFKLKDNVLAITTSVAFPYVTLTTDHLQLLSDTLTFYDGDAFTGGDYNTLGDYGVAVRSETLAFDDDLLTSIYGSGNVPIYLTSDSPSWTSEYPADFRTELPVRAGYHVYNGSDSIHLAGYYCESSRSKFDFHDSPSTAKGLPLQSEDPLGNLTTITYDSYKLFPVTVTDAVGMETSATYDYRVMQANQVTDPNGNRSQVGFSPLGFVIKTAVMGKSTESKGDTLDHPGTVMEYDFFAFYNEGQPVYVKSTVHEGHYQSGSGGGDYNQTIVSVQYSDGFGRLIQSRAQCEEVIFGDELFGDSGLADSTAGTDDDAVGTTAALNVLVSGWQVYNNKGAVVEKYEPYYDHAFTYTSPLAGNDSNLVLNMNEGLVQFPDRPAYHLGTGDFSIEAWIKPTRSGLGYDTILTAWRKDGSGNLFGFNLYLYNNTLYFNIADGTTNVQSSSPFTGHKDQWTHIAAQRIGSNTSDFIVYVNGQAVSVTGGGTLPSGDIDGSTSTTLRIGGHNVAGLGSDYFQGQIQQVRLYNRPLTSNEIVNDFQRGRYGTPFDTDGLLLYVPAQDSVGAIVYDYSTFKAQGTYTGFVSLEDEGPSPAYLALLQGQKVQLFYDPRGQVIRTLNPDLTEQRVIFGIPLALDNPNVYTPTPWESYTYDANDLAEVYTGDLDPDTVPADHRYTPSSSEIDALGRTVKTIDRNYKAAAIEEIEMQYAFDIRDNLLTVADALKNTAGGSGRPYTFQHSYDYLNRPLKTIHIDAGTKTMVMDCMSKPVEARDEKGSLVLSTYDTLNRPTKVWCRDDSSASTTLRHKSIYGDSAGLSTPEDENLKGKPYKQYDEAGLTTMVSYDFKGNPLEKTRQVISDTELLTMFSGFTTSWTPEAYRVDWGTSTDSILDSQAFTSTIEYDALNRVTKLTYPEDVESERKELVPAYNRSGALESVVLDGDTYVDRITYNARGQRILMALGNGIMTRYKYRSDNFRLLRMKSEKYTKSTLDSVITYASAGSVKQNFTYAYDLVGNIISITNAVSGCGVAGTDSLERDFSYDPLYRLLSATGRETAPTATYAWDDTYRPENNGASRAYTQNYDYDKLGNIQELQHLATGGNFTRTFDYVTNSNRINKITVDATDYDFSHDDNGNILSEGDTARKLTYDYADRLKSFAVQTGTAEPSQYALYLYDGGGNRVKKLVRKQGGGVGVSVYIDGIFEYRKETSFTGAIPDLEVGVWVIGEGDGEQNTLHIMDGNSRIATRRLGDALGDTTPDIKYNLEDHLGSSNLLLDTDGANVSSEEYYPFGETSFGSYGKKRYRFCGKERDEESGLYYYGMRYYSAWTCRFISIDPLAAKYPFYSPYQYAGNKPIISVDIDGLEGNNDTGQQKTGGEGKAGSEKNASNKSGADASGNNNINSAKVTDDGITKTTEESKIIEENGVKIKVTTVTEEYNAYRGTNGEQVRTSLPEGNAPRYPVGLKGINDKHPDLGGDKRIKVDLGGVAVIELEVRKHTNTTEKREIIEDKKSVAETTKSEDDKKYKPYNESRDVSLFAGKTAPSDVHGNISNLIKLLQNNPKLSISIIGDMVETETERINLDTKTYDLDEPKEQQAFKLARANAVRNYIIARDKSLASRVFVGGVSGVGQFGITQARISGQIEIKK